MGFLHETEHAGALLVDQASDLATPSASRIKIYSKSGELYKRNSAGTVVQFAVSTNGMADAVILAPGASTRNVIQPSGDFIPIVAKGHASQSVSLFEARNSADAVKVSIGFDGKTIIARGTTTSAAASLDISQVYAPTSGAGSDLSMVLKLDYTDDRRTTNLANRVLRYVYTRAATATNESSTFDALINFVPVVNSTQSSALIGLLAEGPTIASSQTLSTWMAISVSDGAGAGTLTTQYGIKVSSLTKGSTNYAIYTDAGLVRLGDQLSVNGSADRIQAIVKANGTQTNNLIELQNSSGAVQLAIAGNGRDFVLDATTGSKIGTATSQKLAFWNAAPITQPASANQAAVTTTAATQTTPWGYSTQAQADGIITLLNEIRSVLVNEGLMKGAA